MWDLPSICSSMASWQETTASDHMLEGPDGISLKSMSW